MVLGITPNTKFVYSLMVANLATISPHITLNFPDLKGPWLIILHQHPLEAQQSCRQHGHAYSDSDLFSRKNLLMHLLMPDSLPNHAVIDRPVALAGNH